MRILTLTTDMGLTDHYVASLKGKILSEIQDVQIVDITHLINAFDISQAAYHIKNCFADFPKGSIHILAVDAEPIINFGSPQLSSLPAILCYNEHYFVSNDNGVFSLIVGENSFESIWHVDDVLSNPNAFKFPAKNILVPIATKLAKGVKLEEIATKVDAFKRMISINPVVEPNLIRGNIIHIDFYGNVITNIDKSLFYRFGENIPFTIFFRKKEYYIDTISATYGDVPPGE
ncbi:MAG: SAM-dependent chlorinase/fluorinase, partial [Bacteroidota bacterium]